MGAWIGDVWVWNDLGIPLTPSALEGKEVKLRSLLVNRRPVPASPVSGNDEKDRVVWRPSVDGSFSVSSCYSIMEKYSLKFGPPNCYDFVSPFIWKGDIPLKIKAFGQ